MNELGLAYAIARNRAMIAGKLSDSQEIVRKNYRERIAFYMRKLSIRQRIKVIDMSYGFMEILGAANGNS